MGPKSLKPAIRQHQNDDEEKKDGDLMGGTGEVFREAENPEEHPEEVKEIINKNTDGAATTSVSSSELTVSSQGGVIVVENTEGQGTATGAGGGFVPGDSDGFTDTSDSDAVIIMVDSSHLQASRDGQSPDFQAVLVTNENDTIPVELGVSHCFFSQSSPN